MGGGNDICSARCGHSPLFVDLGELQGNLALAAATQAVQKEFAAAIGAAGARTKVCVEPLQYRAPALEERRSERAMVDRSAAAITRRRTCGARIFACRLTLPAGSQ